MNKTYRVLWNRVRGGFVVVGENTRAKGKPKSAHSAIAAAVGAAFLAPGAALANGCPATTPVSTALTTQQCYGDQNVTVDSSGSIKVTNIDTAAQVSVNPYTSTFTNNGTISASAGSGYSAHAYGLNIGGTLSGTLTNAGTISATAGLATAFGYAYGVYVNGDLSGTLNNSGTISATATYGGSGYGVAQAYGVHTNSIASSGKLTNSGTISATATANGHNDYPYAYGVYVSGNVDGSLTNTSTGIISAVATYGGSGYGTANAYGVSTNSITSTGTLTNSGTISAKATHHGTNGSAYAYGVVVNGDIAGSLSNTSTGTISAVAVNNDRWAYAYGIANWGSLSGTLTNAHTISAVASGNGAEAYGVYTNAIANTGTLINSGTISATATANNSSANAYAYGVYVSGNLDGSLTNSGTIRAVANGGSSGRAYGLYVSSLNGVVNNSGTISAKGLGAVPDSSVYSIYVNNGTGTIDNLAGGLLDGQVYAGGSVNLNNAGTIDTRMQTSQVGGNYTQAATGMLRIGATSNAAHGGLAVTGTANLAGGTGFEVQGAVGNTLAVGTVSNVLTSGGLTMPGAKVTDNILALNYAAVANGNNVDLVATPTGLSTVAAVVGGGVGASVGGVLDSLLANIGSQPLQLQNYLYSLGSQTTAQGVADSVSKVLPLISTNARQVELGTSEGVNNVVLARLEGTLGRAAGDTFYGDKHFWLKPFGSWVSQGDRNGISGYDARTAGMVAGVDAEVGKANRLGLAFGYAGSNVDSNSTVAPQNAKIGSYQMVFYGSHKLDAATDANFRAGVGLHDNDGRRTISFGGTSLVASSSYGSWSGNLGGGIARTMKWNESTTFTPSLRADYTTIRNSSYIENGAGALNLNVNSSNAAKFIIGADGKFVHTLSGQTKLVGNLGLGYDLIHKASSVTSMFAGAPGALFSTQGITPSAWLLRGGAGMVFRSGERAEVTARYDVEARTGFTNQTASVNIRWAF